MYIIHKIPYKVIYNEHNLPESNSMFPCIGFVKFYSIDLRATGRNVLQMDLTVEKLLVLTNTKCQHHFLHMTPESPCTSKLSMLYLHLQPLRVFQKDKTMEQKFHGYEWFL